MTNKKITVRVTELGYIFLKRQKPGAILTIDEKDFCSRWMQKVTQKKVVEEDYVADEPEEAVATPVADSSDEPANSDEVI